MTARYPDPRMLKSSQADFNERSAVEYLNSAIQNGGAHIILADLNKLDGMLRELGMQDTDECPIEYVRGLMKSKQ